MKATLIVLLFAAASVYAAPDRTQQTRGQVEDDSNWGDAPAPILPASEPSSVGILPGASVTPSRVVYVRPAPAHSSHSQRAPAGGVKGGAAGGSYDAPAPHSGAPRQFIQSVATPLGLQCYLSNPNALQSLLAPATGEPQLVAVYDQPAPAPAAETPIRDQGVKTQDAPRKSRYPAAASRPAGGAGSQAGAGSQPQDQSWWQNTQQQRAPGTQQAKGYRQVSVVY